MRGVDKIAFATSVLGAGHIKDKKPCQDYSIAWQSKDSGSVVLIVCDGHGSDTYVRSDIGSRLAAQITLEAVKEFVPRKGHTPNPEWIVGHQGCAVRLYEFLPSEAFSFLLSERILLRVLLDSI